MLKYMVVPLCDSAVSFCHYEGGKERKLIDLEVLRKAVRFSMVENLTVQFVFPDYELPMEYWEVMEEVEYGKVCGAKCEMEADVYVCANIDEARRGKTNLWRVRMRELLETDAGRFAEVLSEVERVNVVVTDVDGLTDEDISRYGGWLEELADEVAIQMKDGKEIKCNLLTDRISLERMNNCNAGVESITLAPDGRFYVCPAFYYDGADCVGDLEKGISIPNKKLYGIENAPICRICDAWQCRRCVWMNEKTTMEVNTPGREQCVMAHLERRASKRLADALKLGVEIKDLGYLDPFEVVNN